MQKFHVHGRYVALYKDGRHTGEISYSRELTADSPEKAIIQVAIEATVDFDYQEITWLAIQADPVEDNQP